MFSFSTVKGVSTVRGSEFPGIRYGFSTRKGGVTPGQRASLNLSMKTSDSPENVKANWDRYLEALSLPSDPVFYCRQVHGSDVKYVTSKTADDVQSTVDHVLASDPHFRCVGEYDGVWTDERGLTLTVFTADCVPILLLGCGSHPFVAALHGGWRGLVSGIIPKTLSEISSRILLEPESVHVLAGPHIRSCCFQISQDVADELNTICPGAAVPQQDLVGKYLGDLGMIVETGAKDFGIPEGNVQICQLCTCCNEDVFYSYRRSKMADRGSLSSGIALL